MIDDKDAGAMLKLAADLDECSLKPNVNSRFVGARDLMKCAAVVIRQAASQGSAGVAQAVPDYSAWLIEMPERFGPLYFHFEHDDDWTQDHDKACHFSRKEDAEKVIEHYGWTRAVAVEHMWPITTEDGLERYKRRLTEMLDGAAKRINAARDGSPVPSADRA